MKTYIKTLLLMILVMSVFIPAHSSADSGYHGEMIGLSCLKGEMDCSSDMYKYAHIAYEPDFVLYVDAHKHYMLSNVSRAVKQSLVGKNVIVTGELIRKNTTIDVTKIEVEIDGAKTVVWPKEKKIDWFEEWWREKALYGH